MEEVWKDIKGYEGLYMISSTGKVYSYHTNKILSICHNHGGYCSVQLSNNGKVSRKYVHRLVAEAFIPNPLGLPEVNHKDEDPDNNNMDNLEWCDHIYNNNYGKHSENLSKNHKDVHYGNHPQARPVKCVELNRIFSCAMEAADYFSIDNSDIGKVCKGKARICGGYHWVYVE